MTPLGNEPSSSNSATPCCNRWSKHFRRCAPEITASSSRSEPRSPNAEFQADIAERRVRVPIEIIDGSVIVDGRSRYLAAKQLGVEQVPVIRAPLNGDDPVISTNQSKPVSNDSRSPNEKPIAHIKLSTVSTTNELCDCLFFVRSERRLGGVINLVLHAMRLHRRDTDARS